MGLVLRSTQPALPPHCVCPAAHWHWPDTQVPDPQVRPHCPQLVALELQSTQPVLPPHSVCPAAHWHLPETHAPSPQLVLQVPQCAASVERLKHPEGQETSAASHWQSPFTQLAPGLQVTAPQVTPPELDVPPELEVAPLDVLVLPGKVPVSALPLQASSESHAKPSTRMDARLNRIAVRAAIRRTS